MHQNTVFYVEFKKFIGVIIYAYAGTLRQEDDFHALPIAVVITRLLIMYVIVHSGFGVANKLGLL